MRCPVAGGSVMVMLLQIALPLAVHVHRFVRIRSGPVLMPVKHSKKLDSLFSDPVRNNEGRASYHQLACSAQTSDTAHLRMPLELTHRGKNPLGDPPSSAGIILRDVASDANEVADCCLGPNDLYSGGSPSSSRAQLSSHFATLSWSTTRPAVASARPAATASKYC